MKTATRHHEESKRRTVIQAIAVLVAAGALAFASGCGDDDETEPANGSGETTAETTDEDAAYRDDAHAALNLLGAPIKRIRSDDLDRLIEVMEGHVEGSSETIEALRELEPPSDVAATHGDLIKIYTDYRGAVEGLRNRAESGAIDRNEIEQGYKLHGTALADRLLAINEEFKKGGVNFEEVTPPDLEELEEEEEPPGDSQ